MDGPSRQCGECGYDLRGSGRSAQCPECGARIPPLTQASIEATELAGASGLGLVANSLFASLPALTGLILLGVLGRAVAIIAALSIGFRLAGLWRHRQTEFRDSIPDWFLRLLWISAGIETSIALFAAAMIVLPLGLPSPRAWWLAVSGLWGLAAGVGIAAIAFGCDRIIRRLGPDWLARTATIAGVACLLASLAAAVMAAVGLWIGLGGARNSSMVTGLAMVVAVPLGPIAAIVGIAVTRLLLVSIDEHAIATAVDARLIRRDPLREIGVPVRPIDAPNAPSDDPLPLEPLPLEPAKPPVRDDL